MDHNISLVSIIIPVYNEERSILIILDKVLKSDISISKEIVVVNDGSTDTSEDLILDFIATQSASVNCKFIYIKQKNSGKGSAVRSGISKSQGNIILIQDADLEYDPDDYHILIQPILDQRCKVVYGSRILGKRKTANVFYYLGGLLITFITNLLYESSLTDEPTCYKVFSREIFEKIQIDSNGFEWEPEVTAKILRRGYNIKEVPIKYYARSFKEGKKITISDGIKAIGTLWKYRNWIN